jgi:hypothetical protein
MGVLLFLVLVMAAAGSLLANTIAACPVWSHSRLTYNGLRMSSSRVSASLPLSVLCGWPLAVCNSWRLLGPLGFRSPRRRSTLRSAVDCTMVQDRVILPDSIDKVIYSLVSTLQSRLL